MGLGAIIRNRNGEVLVLGLRKIQFFENVEVAKTQAVIFGLELATTLSFRKCILKIVIFCHANKRYAFNVNCSLEL